MRAAKILDQRDLPEGGLIVGDGGGTIVIWDVSTGCVAVFKFGIVKLLFEN